MGIKQTEFAALQKQVAEGTLSLELYHQIVWKEYHNFVWNTVRKYCFKPGLMDDCFQEASAALFWKLPDYKPERAAFTTFIKPWLRRYILNHVFASALPFCVSSSYSYKYLSAEPQRPPVPLEKIQIKDSRDGLNKIAARHDLEKIARRLTKRQKAITFQYFGIGCHGENYETIAKHYSLTRQRIEQIVAASLHKMGWRPRPTQRRMKNKKSY